MEQIQQESALPFPARADPVLPLYLFVIGSIRRGAIHVALLVGDSLAAGSSICSTVGLPNMGSLTLRRSSPQTNGASNSMTAPTSAIDFGCV